MKKYFFLLFVVSIFPAITYGQNISFEVTKHDFGKVAEGTIATYDFVFKNTGDQPLILSKVTASCGCTTPYWPKEPVMPGKEGKITASFNSKNRPGTFNKSVTVVSNSGEATQRLYIRGMVVPEEEKEVYTKEELANSPVIEIKKTAFNLGKVQIGESIPFEVEIHNSGYSELNITNIQAACNCIQADRDINSTIGMGEHKVFTFIYKPRREGKGIESVSISSNDVTKKALQINVEADVVKSLNQKSILQEGKETIDF